MIHLLTCQRRGSPLVEEGLLIGFAILLILILAGAILNVVSLSESSINDFLRMIQNIFGNYN